MERRDGQQETVSPGLRRNVETLISKRTIPSTLEKPAEGNQTGLCIFEFYGRFF